MAETRCASCGAAMSDTDRVCPSCGAPAAPPSGVGGPVPEPATASAAPARGLATPLNFARMAKLLALLFFILPWVTVTCAGHPLVSVSGVEMVTGTATVTNPVTGATETRSAEPDLMVLIAALLIAGALAASFLPRRRLAAIAGLVGSGVAAGLIVYSVFVGFRIRMHGELDEGGGEAVPNGLDEQLAQMIVVDVAAGFWLTVAALAAAAILNLRLLIDRAGPTG